MHSTNSRNIKILRRDEPQHRQGGSPIKDKQKEHVTSWLQA